ncbi:hypothetical protein MNBD_GAMMA11-2460 [hydrothermal vent metagenome]|uniref:Peptidase M15C domain-containing protein n=1 Tax=hydrothermal vent metagenome TaxID=652676 RepID=A0A3B0XPD6_9ZZZZ
MCAEISKMVFATRYHLSYRFISNWRYINNMPVISKAITLYLLLAPLLSLCAETKMCSYSTYAWNVNTKSVTNYHRVSHRYSELQAFERDKITACSVCEEDQRELVLRGVKPFKVCKKMYRKIESALINAMDSGKKIETVVGYRVGLTRGKVDSMGNRTAFSHHSFGIAIDINSAYNGLYDKCLKFTPACRLRKGGRWVKGYPMSLTPSDIIVKNLKGIGLKWGGEIKGWQKDFMHFSPDGY